MATLAVDSRGQPVVLLAPVEPAQNEQRKVLPIWIGMQEATAIMLVVEGTEAPRPMAYDLMITLIERLDASVRQVAVTRLEEGTFFAEITLSTPSGERVIDARPSDSIALAVRTGARIYLAEDVFAEAAVDEPAEDGEKESEVAAFQEFLDSVNPEDFRG